MVLSPQVNLLEGMLGGFARAKRGEAPPPLFTDLVCLLLHSRQVPVYIWAPEEEGQFQPGRCSRWWLHHSLTALDSDLRVLGSRLLCFRGADSHAVLARLAATLGASAVLFNHLYDPISMVGGPGRATRTPWGVARAQRSETAPC